MSFFAKAPHNILHNHDLSAVERILLIHLMDVQGKNNNSWHKQSTMAKKLGFARCTINVGIAKLETLGFIRIERQREGVRYTVLPFKTKDKEVYADTVGNTDTVDEPDLHCRKNLHDTVGNTDTLYIEELDQLELDQRTRPNTFGDFEKVDEKIEVVEAEVIQPLEVEPPPKKAKPPKQVQTFDAEFDEFWENYPRSGGINKGSKQKAKQIFTKILTHTKTQPDEITQGLQAYAAYLEHTGTFSAHATTWLNQGRWEDDYTIVPSNRNKQSSPERPRAYGDTLCDVFDRVRAAHGI